VVAASKLELAINEKRIGVINIGVRSITVPHSDHFLYPSCAEICNLSSDVRVYWLLWLGEVENLMNIKNSRRDGV
jgi:hypothetical protein